MKISLRQGLTRWLWPSLLAAFAVAGAVAYLVGQHAARIAYDQALMAVAEDVALGVRFIGHVPRLELNGQAEHMLRSDVRDKIFFVVRTDSGAYVAGDADLPSAPLVSLRNGRSTDLRYRGEAVRVLSMRFDQDEAPYVVSVAETLGKRRAMAGSVLLFLIAPAVLVLLLGGAGIVFAVQQGLRPLHLLEQALETRSESDLSPIDVANVPGEVRSLVQTLNGLLQRLERATRAQQKFVADAAHQLRTPLAGIQAQVELLAAADPTAHPAMVERLRAAVSRAVRLANQLLALTRSERDRIAIAYQSVDLARLVADAADEWVHLAMARGVDLGFDLRPAPASGESWLLREMMDNLVDNAMHYGGAAGRVTVSTGVQDGEVFFRVDDSGPGIPAADRRRVLQRFYRLPNSPGDGSGLGLAIVEQIASQHHGQVAIEDSPMGGARVAVALPALDRAPATAPEAPRAAA